MSRLRPEKPGFVTEGRGFDSRHLHQPELAYSNHGPQGRDEETGVRLQKRLLREALLRVCVKR
jgi:hypothetical protein